MCLYVYYYSYRCFVGRLIQEINNCQIFAHNFLYLFIHAFISNICFEKYSFLVFVDVVVAAAAAVVVVIKLY